MAGDDVVESESSDSNKKHCEIKSVNECICGAIAKTGFTCGICKIKYHKSCVNRIKSCCNVPLGVANLKMPISSLGATSEITNKHECEYSYELIKSLKDLIAELQLNKSILIDKVNNLQIENNYLKTCLNQNAVHNFAGRNNICNQNNIKIVDNENGSSVSTITASDSIQPQESSDKSSNTSYAQVTKTGINLNNVASIDFTTETQRFTPISKIIPSNKQMNIQTQLSDDENLSNRRKILNTSDTVQKKFKKITRGNAKWEDDNFSAGSRKAWFYVGRAKRNCANDDICNYLKKRFPSRSFIAEKIENKSETTSAFKGSGQEFNLETSLSRGYTVSGKCPPGPTWRIKSLDWILWCSTKRVDRAESWKVRLVSKSSKDASNGTELNFYDGSVHFYTLFLSVIVGIFHA
ncbi:hypothetical protein FQR65_LT12743 [Abscondita terminalis]|nr:hypothetical protein FQR65_LT12743 [Abscondita terminalis]